VSLIFTTHVTTGARGGPFPQRSCGLASKEILAGIKVRLHSNDIIYSTNYSFIAPHQHNDHSARGVFVLIFRCWGSFHGG